MVVGVVSVLFVLFVLCVVLIFELVVVPIAVVVPEEVLGVCFDVVVSCVLLLVLKLGVVLVTLVV